MEIHIVTGCVLISAFVFFLGWRSLRWPFEGSLPWPLGGVLCRGCWGCSLQVRGVNTVEIIFDAGPIHNRRNDEAEYKYLNDHLLIRTRARIREERASGLRMRTRGKLETNPVASIFPNLI